MPPLRLLVIGASGYLGTSLIPYLTGGGFRVRALVEENAEVAFNPDVEVVRGDVRDAGLLVTAMAGCEVIVHLAGVKGPDTCAQAIMDAVDANILFLRQVLQAIKNPAVQVIFTSTYWVYGHKAPRPYREDQPLMPSEPYGWLKAVAERMVMGAGVNYTIVRLANIFGYGGGRGYEEVTSSFLQRALQGQSIRLNNEGRHRIDLISIDDVCAMLTQMIGLKPHNLVLNVGSGIPLTIKELAERVNNISRKLTSQQAEIIMGAKESDEIIFADRWVSTEKLQQYVNIVPTALDAALKHFASQLLARGRSA